MRRFASLSVLLLALLGVPALFVAFSSLEDGGAEAGDTARKRGPKEEALIELGRRLFFDPVVSRSAARSCASCHDPEHGFSDPARVSDDDIGRTRRHSQTLLDSHLNPSAHWDGEFESIEELVLARIGAIKGRKGKLGHGTTVFEAVQQEVGGEDAEGLLGGDAELEEEVEDDLLEDDEDTDDTNDDDNPYTDGPSERSGATPAKGAAKSRAASDGAKGGAAPSAPAAGAPKADADKPAAEPKAEPKPKADAKADAEPQEKAKPSREEIQRRANALRAELRRLPLAEDVLEHGRRYDEAFEAAFGNRKVNAQRVARAIAAYCRSIESTTAPFDRFRAGQQDAISESAKRGLALFRGRGQCASCHTMKGEHPTFTDFEYHNTGVVWHRLSKAQWERLAGHDETFRRKRDDLETVKGPDEGRARISTIKRDLRAFKTPTLRDVARRGPFMHDGRFKTLRDVVAYYARGGSPDPARASHVKAFVASAQDIADLVAFMETLSGDTRPGLPAKAWRERAGKTRIQLVDADGKPLVGWDVRLEPVGDRAYADAGIHPLPGTRRTDARGILEFTNRRTTHTLLVLPGGLRPVGGGLVPDSCEKATVRVPVRGRAEIVVRFPEGAQPPALLAADHVGTVVLPGHQAPRTRFTRGKVLEMGRTRVARYEGWMRTDVPSTVRVRLPGLAAGKRDVVLERGEPARIDLATK